jgi:hypothetical protein
MGKIQFTLEERVRVENIKEVLKSSLTHDINNEEHEEYISLRGRIKFNADFITLSGEQEQIEQLFPVDITVPKRRMDGKEIVLSIPSHEVNDYDNFLWIEAEVQITGIKEE